jgi:hypothetical protein
VCVQTSILVNLLISLKDKLDNDEQISLVDDIINELSECESDDESESDDEE